MSEEVKETLEVNEVKEDTGTTFTQEQVDELIKKKSGKYLKKIDELKSQVQKGMISERIKNVIAEGLNFEGNDEELLRAVGDHYGKNGAKILNDYVNGDVSKKEAEIKLETLEFLENDDTTDDDIISEYEELADKPKSKLSKADNVKMEILAKKYFKAKSKHEAKKAEQWYEKNIGGDFEEVVSSQGFRDFIDDLNIPLSSALKKYCSLKDIKKPSEKKEGEKPMSTGSVKDAGNGTPEFYSPEDVAKMSREEIREHLKAIEQSQKNWYKK